MQEEAERKANYKLIVKDVSKWQPIVKRNRESEHLDLTQNIQSDSKRMYCCDSFNFYLKKSRDGL